MNHAPKFAGRIRFAVWCFLVIGVLFVTTSFCRAQFKATKWKIKDTRIGFIPYSGDSSANLFKPGLWTPVYLTLEQAPKGRLVFPLEQDDFATGKLTVSVNDGDGIKGSYHAPFSLGKMRQRETILAYANPAGISPDFSFTINSKRSSYSSKKMGAGLFPGHLLYLTLGNKAPGLHQALVKLSGDKEKKDSSPRHATYQTNVSLLPDKWFGYQAADLVVLLTSDKKFVTELAREDARIEALAQWVRRGGRLVVSISWNNVQEVDAILNSQKWQPPLPAVFRPGKRIALASSPGIRGWCGGPVFRPNENTPLQIVDLQPNKASEILAQEPTGEALLVRYPYGRGNITLVAFELDRSPFTAWKGKEAFWERAVLQLGPRVAPLFNQNGNANLGFRRGEFAYGADISTELHRQLDNFDVPQISFGWVALFILLFILIVGPVDFLILRFVFKRLEWTWITFPAVVLIVTVASYFTAYWIKGDKLKINKVDLVDVDLRTELTADFKTKNAYAYGTSWFSILSPRIQDYTVGIQPALHTWAPEANANPQQGEVMVTWLGRPEAFGPGAMGGGNSASLFRRQYDYAPGATGIQHVPIPVWTTKAFTASWEASFDVMPFTADLAFQTNERDQKLEGTVTNHLSIDLSDCYFIYGQKYYPIEGGLPKRRGQAEPKPVRIKLDPGRAAGVERWAHDAVVHNERLGFGEKGYGGDRYFNPGPILSLMYFFEKSRGRGDNRQNEVNHAFRRLDQSWRVDVQDKMIRNRDSGVRTAILIGRVARAKGSAEGLTGADDPRLPAHLWLGDVPDGKNTRPALPASPESMIQETYVRIFIPVRPVTK